MLVEKIRKLMEDKNIKQKDLVDYLGASQSNVSKWLSKNEDIRLDIPNTILAKIAKLLNVSVEYLLGFDEIPLKTIPLIGIASCGVPNLTYCDIIEHIPVPADLARDGVYAVKADGDSMLPKINSGDIIVCDKEQECLNGNIVHYTTIDGESGLKKYQEKDGMATLYPLNTDGYAPIVIPVKDLKCARAIKIVADL